MTSEPKFLASCCSVQWWVMKAVNCICLGRTQKGQQSRAPRNHHPILCTPPHPSPDVLKEANKKRKEKENSIMSPPCRGPIHLINAELRCHPQVPTLPPQPPERSAWVQPGSQRHTMVCVQTSSCKASGHHAQLLPGRASLNPTDPQPLMITPETDQLGLWKG